MPITEESRKKASETRRKNTELRRKEKAERLTKKPQVYLTGEEIDMYDFLYPVRFACRCIHNYILSDKLERVVMNPDTWQNPPAIINAISPYVEIVYGRNPHPDYKHSVRKRVDKKPKRNYIMTEEHKQKLAESRKRRKEQQK